MTQFNTELLPYDHDLHAYLVDAEQRYQQLPIASVALATVTSEDGTVEVAVAEPLRVLTVPPGALVRPLERPAIPFRTVALMLAEAFVAGQRHPSTAASYTVQHSTWTTAEGEQGDEWDVANRAEVVATFENESEAIAKARELNRAETCDACESFMLLAAQAGQSIA